MAKDLEVPLQGRGCSTTHTAEGNVVQSVPRWKTPNPNLRRFRQTDVSTLRRPVTCASELIARRWQGPCERPEGSGPSANSQQP